MYGFGQIQSCFFLSHCCKPQVFNKSGEGGGESSAWYNLFVFIRTITRERGRGERLNWLIYRGGVGDLGYWPFQHPLPKLTKKAKANEDPNKYAVRLIVSKIKIPSLYVKFYN